MFIKIKEQLIELFEEEPRCTNRERVHDSNGNYIALMRSICGNPRRDFIDRFAGGKVEKGSPGHHEQVRRGIHSHGAASEVRR